MIAANRDPDFSKVKSPCIGVCSTGIGDSVCRGCKRFIHEIIQWNAYSDTEKRAVQKRLDVLLTQVVEAKVNIVDSVLLRKQLQHQCIAFELERHPATWVFALLRAGANQITSLREFGLAVLPSYESLSAVAIKEEIDRDFYQLSAVHYERYFQVHM